MSVIRALLGKKKDTTQMSEVPENDCE